MYCTSTSRQLGHFSYQLQYFEDYRPVQSQSDAARCMSMIGNNIG